MNLHHLHFWFSWYLITRAFHTPERIFCGITINNPLSSFSYTKLCKGYKEKYILDFEIHYRMEVEYVSLAEHISQEVNLDSLPYVDREVIFFVFALMCSMMNQVCKK